MVNDFDHSSMVMLRQGPRRLNGGASTSAFYGTPPAVHSRTTWLPGEVIECGNTGTSRRNVMEELKGWMHQLVADMQTSILGRISDIEQNIQSLWNLFFITGEAK